MKAGNRLEDKTKRTQFRIIVGVVYQKLLYLRRDEGEPRNTAKIEETLHLSEDNLG